jgi:hypothetical protein
LPIHAHRRHLTKRRIEYAWLAARWIFGVVDTGRVLAALSNAGCDEREHADTAGENNPFRRRADIHRSLLLNFAGSVALVLVDFQLCLN